MKVIKTELNDCLIIEPQIFSDERGCFMETFQSKRYMKANIDHKFVQDNLSVSKQNVLRGLHFQIKNPQGKLVRVAKGEVYDVALDLRKNSETYLKWIGVYLSEENKKQLWIPPGFAHGFQTISREAVFEYKCTDYYDPNDEYTLLWNDPKLNINWPSNKPILSKKDKEGLSIDEI